VGGYVSLVRGCIVIGFEHDDYIGFPRCKYSDTIVIDDI
jgi:hypothetical protein